MKAEVHSRVPDWVGVERCRRVDEPRIICLSAKIRARARVRKLAVKSGLCRVETTDLQLKGEQTEYYDSPSSDRSWFIRRSFRKKVSFSKSSSCTRHTECVTMKNRKLLVISRIFVCTVDVNRIWRDDVPHKKNGNYNRSFFPTEFLRARSFRQFSSRHRGAPMSPDSVKITLG